MFKLKEIVIYLRASFWFVPSLFVVSSIILALALIEVDDRYSGGWIRDWPRLFGAGAEASRGVLSTIASSMMSMMTVAFSMTLVTLALASSQYTSRILRNFMRNRITQVVLGTFAGIFTYCLVVLRTIRGGNVEYIPGISVNVGFVLAVVGVGVLVLFIHHIASSIQASNIIASASEETIAVIEKLFPENMGRGKDEVEIKDTTNFMQSIFSTKTGYIQSVAEDELIELSKKLKTVIKMNYGIGDFIITGMPIASISDDLKLDEKQEDELREMFSISRFRTIEQDPLFGIRQIVDVALKALSPGVNDTTTGVMCIDYLTAIMASLTLRQIPSIYRYSEGHLRVIAKAPGYEKFLHECFDQIRTNSQGNVAVIQNLLNSVEVLSQLTSNPLRRHWLSLEVDRINDVLEDSIKFKYDKNVLENKFDSVKNRFRYS